MGEKLLQGDRLPKVAFQLLDGRTITLPDDAPTRYTALLFYRGHWWPYCNRQLAEWEANKSALEELDVTTYAVSVDTKELAQKVVDNNKLTFPMAYSATKADGDMLGS